MTEDTVDVDTAGESDPVTDGGSDAGGSGADVETDGGSDAGGSGADEETVDAGTVEHVAGLARVNLEAGERERFVEQFADILEYFETLDEVPEVERDPELTNVMRPDEVADSLDRAEALYNAPETEDGQFKGPRVS